MFNKIISFIVAIFLPLSIGFGASHLAPNTATVYSQFTLPPLAPHGAVFGLVWTILYIFMGIASYIVWIKPNIYKTDRQKAIFLYLFQLGVNFFWTYFFFALNWKLFAFFWLIFLLILLMLCMQSFRKISVMAFSLLIPYLLWGLFAAYLNLSLYILNS